MEGKSKNVCVVVLGDIGRSPRMQYHGLSLAEMGHKVDIIGYGETEPMDEVKTSPTISYHYLLKVPTIPIKLLNYLFKPFFQMWNLLLLLLITRKPHVILVQNPPAIPALIICWLVAKCYQCKFVIDWHNYAHTIMALTNPPGSPLVRITEKIEAFAGSRADHNFCVTNAMKKNLSDNWNISATTLYDRPPLMFKPISLKERHDFLCKLGQTFKELLCNDGSTLFTEEVQNIVKLKDERPGLLVSSTSWTEDEDFSLLFSVLQEYEDHILNGNQRKLADLICFITGKGHMKDHYCDMIAKQNWKHVIVITPWLESKDYPLILASADLGVCLHTSSSGLDLPMKVVDMFGCGLPVCAYDFFCLDELVQHGKNGYKFSSVAELSEQLQGWFHNFPNDENQQLIENNLKAELKSFQSIRWKQNWIKVASPVFQ